MEITSVNVRKIRKEDSKVKAIASIVIDDAIAIHDIRLLDGRDGMFMAMPSRRIANGKYKDVAHPISQEVRTQVEEAIFKKYDEVLEEEENEIAEVDEDEEDETEDDDDEEDEE